MLVVFEESHCSSADLPEVIGSIRIEKLVVHPLGRGTIRLGRKRSLEAVVVVQPSTREVLPAHLLYHLVSQGFFSVESLSCCFD